MIKLIRLFFIMAMLGCSSENNSNNQENSNTLHAGVNEIFVQQNIDGSIVSRSVYIRLPEIVDETLNYPVVFFFHGAGGSNLNFLNNPFVVEQINSGQFVGIYPNGYANPGSNGGFWNLGSEPTNANDVEFVDLIFEQLQSYSVLNTAEAYAVGYSNGAGMVNLLGKQTIYFKAIAPLYSQQLTSIGAMESVSDVAVFQLNGEVDNIVPLDGGTSSVGTFMSAEDSALNWVSNMSCNTNSSQSNVTWGAITLDRYEFSSCQNDKVVIYLIARNVGHGWNDTQADEQLYNAIWSFFLQN